LKLFDDPPVHLTYCLNVHPGETWEDNFEAIRTKTLKIRKNIAPDKPFGLGVWLSRIAAGQLASEERLTEFKDFLNRNDLYVFSINGFPFGSFHGTAVKENVYHPDWRTPERVEYTCLLADLLTNLLPPGVTGSISTVPGSYKKWIRSESDQTRMVHNLMDCVAHVATIKEQTGTEIHIGLEPEPDCFLETTPEVISFFNGAIHKEGRPYLAGRMGCSESAAKYMIAGHLGVCFDTCHMALQFENLPESIAKIAGSGIRLSKIQISAAIKSVLCDGSAARLKDFCDPVYLHQVKVLNDSGEMTSCEDLTDALNMHRKSDRHEQWRAHCHVPLYFTGDNILDTTAADLTPEFFRQIIHSGASHLEIETYTFDVLPEALRSIGIVKSVSNEYRWVLDRIYQ